MNNSDYSQRAYIVEIDVMPNKIDGVPGDDTGAESAAGIDLIRQTPSEVSIGELIGNVNTDRFRKRRDDPFRFAAVKLRDRSVRWAHMRHKEALEEVVRVPEERDGG